MQGRKYDKKDESYNYLLNLSVSSFTKDKLDSLNKDISKVEEDIKILENTTCKQLWLNDLEKFEQKYIEWLDELEQKEQAKLKKTVKTVDKKKRK
jgi:DNA topoisomerase-2